MRDQGTVFPGISRSLDFIRPIVIVIAIVLGCASAAALTTSRLYWGYWILLPAADWAVSPLASTQRFTSFFCCTDAQSGRKALMQAAQGEWEGAGDAPVAARSSASCARAFSCSGGGRADGARARVRGLAAKPPDQN
jgi:hypothetical protein